MRLTPALYVRQLLAKLHPPLPQTPRDSQRLLTLLESSFKKHLDEIHPSPQGRGDGVVSASQTIPLSPIDSPSVTSHHLNSVLTHPLLDTSSVNRSGKQSFTNRAVSSFDTANIENRITIEILVSCAKQYITGIRNGERVSEEQRLGPKVASWLYAVSPELKQACFLNADFINCITPVMAHDGQDATMWGWLRMLYERDFGLSDHNFAASLQDVRWLQAEDTFVSSLMRSSIHRRELTDATKQFVEACQYRIASGRALVSHGAVDSVLAYVPMSSSWKRLAAAIIHSRNHHGIPADLFSTALRYSLPWSVAPQFSEVLVAIYHPSSASAELLCGKLRNAAIAAAFLRSQAGASKAHRKAILIALLDGAQTSLDQSLKEDASLLLNFVSTHYSDMVPNSSKQEYQNSGLQQRLDVLKDVVRRPSSSQFQLNLV